MIRAPDDLPAPPTPSNLRYTPEVVGPGYCDSSPSTLARAWREKHQPSTRHRAPERKSSPNGGMYICLHSLMVMHKYVRRATRAGPCTVANALTAEAQHPMS